MRTLVVFALAALPAVASAQTVPRRQIPPTVLAELSVLEQRFEIALAADCHPDRCWSKGCAYVDHAVLDRPRAASLPGLGDGTGPGAVVPQEFLTNATCAFAYEPTVSVEDAEAIGRRLQSKVSHGFTVVSVSRQELLALDEQLQQRPVPPPPEEIPEPPVPPAPKWTVATAVRELWSTVLPHVPWMLALGLGTMAATVLFWAWRRVGRETVEEKALLAQLLREGGGGDEAPGEVAEPEGDDPAVAERAEAWRDRVAAARPDAPDADLTALVRELLRDRDLPTLAKAVLTLPPGFVASFPSGGDVAAQKLELAAYLKGVDADELPDDEVFYRTLDRLSRSAALSAQGDARLLRSLREDFGAAGLASLMDDLPDRACALLFALSPLDDQIELTRRLQPPELAGLAGELARSDRMDDREQAYLFSVLEAARAGDPMPTPPEGPISERGAPFDAAGPLSVLLSALSSEDRARLVTDVTAHTGGHLPGAFRGLAYPDLLLALPTEARADLLLEVDAGQLAAWMSFVGDDARGRLMEGMPRALRATLDGAVPPNDRDRRLALATQGRIRLARGLQGQLSRAGLSLHLAVTQGRAA